MNTTASDTVRELSCPQCGAPVWLPSYADMAACAWCGSNLVVESSGAPAVGASGPEDAPATATGPASGRVLRSVSCPQCAGPLEVRHGRRVLSCRRCGTRLLVGERDGFSRWYLEATVDRAGAAGAAAAWLAVYPGIAKKARSARLDRAQLVFIPIWEHKALVAGWEFGDKLRTQTQLVGERNGERLELELRKVGVKEPRLQERRFYQTACDLDALGSTRPRFSGRELFLPLLAGELDPEAIVLAPGSSAREIAERGRRAALLPVSGAGSPDCHAFLLRESVSLLFFPLWVLHYQADGRAFRVVVDGRSGTVNSAAVPADVSAAQRQVGLKGAVLLVVAAILVWLGTAFPDARVPLLAAAVIVSAASVYVGLRSRVRGEVEYHEPFSS